MVVGRLPAAALAVPSRRHLAAGAPPGRARLRLHGLRPRRMRLRGGRGPAADHPRDPPVGPPFMTVLRSVALFAAAAVFEIGGAWLVWQGVREHRGRAWIGAGAATHLGRPAQPRPARRPGRAAGRGRCRRKGEGWAHDPTRRSRTPASRRHGRDRGPSGDDRKASPRLPGAPPRPSGPPRRRVRMGP